MVDDRRQPRICRDNLSRVGCAVYNCPCDDLRLDIEGQVFEVQRIVFADTSECVEATRRGRRDAGI